MGEGASAHLPELLSRQHCVKDGWELSTYTMGLFNTKPRHGDQIDLQLGQIQGLLMKMEAREAPVSALSPEVEAKLAKVEGELVEVQRRLDQFTLGLAEGIDRVERSERRVRQTISGAKRRFEAEGFVDPGLEAEAALLPESNGDSGPAEEVQPVSDGVEPGEEHGGWASVPGMN